MKKQTRLISPVLFAVTFLATQAFADTVEKQVIALKTNDFELAETDVSDLAIGEARTIVTENGKTIDILKAADGLEIYIDGELLEMPSKWHAGDGEIHEKVNIHCVDEVSDCTEDVMFFSKDSDVDFDFDEADGAQHKVIIKEEHISCNADAEDECTEKMVWVSDGDEVSLEDFDGEVYFSEDGEVNIEEILADREGTKVVRIHRDHDDSSSGQKHKVKIIRKEKVADDQ